MADTHLLAAHTDATIMVVQIGQTDRAQVRKVLEELKISGASVLGIVANSCKNTGHSYRQRPVVLDTLYDQKLSALGTKNPN
ncbi:hypothetical protein QUA40_10540 [Microcoleus sp. Pol11C3]|uniref:hypothetical protein n=1 Tax=Microcoleus sp. Pol11C3 TaxID=3055390 RepID=UPI002FD744D7